MSVQQYDQGSVVLGEEIQSSSSSSSSPSTSTSSTTPPPLSPAEIQRANEELANAEPQQILAWAMAHVPRLYQTTAFGLTGLAALDMISKLSSAQGKTHAVPLIFINTLYHFPETLALAAEASQKYGAEMHVYMPPAAQSVAQFEAIYGERLWEVDEESYDYLVKVRASSFFPRTCIPAAASIVAPRHATRSLCFEGQGQKRASRSSYCAHSIQSD